MKRVHIIHDPYKLSESTAADAENPLEYLKSEFKDGFPEHAKIYKGSIAIEIKEDGKYVVVVISDSGIGINEDVRKNIFNPFFTTKDKGVGLGLFIVHNIVQAHNGYIEVESTEGVGTSFFVYLPKDGK